ncbi:hypothetical protein [Paraburkholderia phenazinium]|uniref:hypothetical protein n=1 Tax=Paraburkholderia phenazinium TaxID=60549 RepID=UPI00158AFB74|nr:hypothetical protein [Paraburkholderia phenazinium]
MTPFLVCEFGKSTLSNLVRECFGSNFPDIFRKKQIDYLFRYLSDLGTKSVLLECEYVDKDFLEDYSRFYVKRFNSLGAKCARLHFFSQDVDHRKIEEILAAADDGAIKALQAAYLGFIVVKPLPKTFIGKTCLRRYDHLTEALGVRTLTRRYEVNLFGLPLFVDTIAFQEQDKVVSACATTSIWSALNALPWRSVRAIPSCSEITTSAINFIDGSSNSFPNKELSNKQILRALDVEGLRHHMQSLEAVSQREFFETIKCYIDSGLPLILGTDVYAVDDGGKLARKGGHAVTVLGYKFTGEASMPTKTFSRLQLSDDALYLHDDRLGPFARARFAAITPSGEGEPSIQWGLVVQEKDDRGEWQAPHELLHLKELIVASDRKVRLPPFFAINTANTVIHVYEKEVQRIAVENDNTEISALLNQLSYDVRLEEIATLKRHFMKDARDQAFTDEEGHELTAESHEIEALKSERIRFLTGSFSRFQWVVTFKYRTHRAFKMLIDATDIPQGDAVSAVLVCNKMAANATLEVLRASAKSHEALHALGEEESQTFFTSFLRRLGSAESGLDDHLNRTYGAPRAPRKLKESEFKDGQILVNQTLERFYEPIDKPLNEKFPDLVAGDEDSYLIWAIGQDGALLVGREINQMGHPCLTGFKPARIAGELRRTADGWVINAKSGRYSQDYDNRMELLKNALSRFQTLFYCSRDQITVQTVHQ